MRLLFFFVIFFSSSLLWAKTFCLSIEKQTEAVPRFDKKSRVTFYLGEELRPIKKNSSKTYILAQKRESYYWLKAKDVKVTKKERCSSNSKKKKKRSSSFAAPFSKKRFQFRLGYSLLGKGDAGDGMITSVANANDVRKDPNPIFLDSNLNSSLALSFFYRWFFEGQQMLRVGLAYRMSTVSVEGFKNPDSYNNGAPLALSDLTESIERDLSYNSLGTEVDFGWRLMEGSKYRLSLYAGVSLEYRLEDSFQEKILVCGTDSCPFKSTEGALNAVIDQFVYSPKIAIDFEYGSWLMGLDFSLYYHPTLHIGYQF